MPAESRNREHDIPSEEEATKLLLRNGWSRQSISVWLRARGRCEYCNCDLLACADAHFHGSEIDHIDPGGGEALENLALSCRACNRIKHNFRFLVDGDHSRRERIEAAREYINEVRSSNRQRLARSIEWLRCCGL